MFAKNKNILLSVFFVITVVACNLPGGRPPTQGTSGNYTDTPTVAFTSTFTSIAPVLSETPTATIAAAACKPTVTTSVVANIRSGPGQVYSVIGTLPQGGTANVAGKSSDGSWWYIEFAAGTGGFA